MNNKKIAIIDIDNTLWDFATILYEKLYTKLGSSVPPPSEWHCWSFWKEFCNAETFYKIVREIHLKQDRFGVYPDARDFLKTIKSTGFKIIIASHRDSETHNATLKWLYNHQLAFDELHLSNDKTKLFHNCHICVDDSPEILKSAINKGLLATGLEFPWNKEVQIKLHPNLKEVLNFLLNS